MPDFTPAADVASTVSCAGLAIEPRTPTVLGACGNPIIPTLVTTPSAASCEGAMAWVFNYADCAGNSHNWTYTYNIDMPDFTPAADVASTVSCPALAIQPPTPTVLDACGNPIIPTLVTTPSAASCEGAMAWVFNYADCAGNSHNWTYTYNIDMPDFTPAADVASSVTIPRPPRSTPSPYTPLFRSNPIIPTLV